MVDSFSWVILYIAPIVLLALNYYSKTHWSRTSKLVNKFPGARLWPFIGNGYSVIGPANNIQEKMTKYYEKYGRVCRFWRLDRPQIFIAEASVCQKILSSSAHIEKGNEYDVLRVNLGDGLLTSCGQKWSRDRKLLNPGFTRQQMHGFVEVCNKKSKIMVEQLAMTFNGCKEPKAENFLPYFANVSLEIVFESALETEINIQTDMQHSRFAHCMEIIAKVAQARLFYPWLLHIPFLFKISGYHKMEKDAWDYCRRFISNAWHRKKVEIETRGVKRDLSEESTGKSRTKPFIELLLEANLGSEQYCLDHLNTLVIAGAETTANSINNTLLYLALYPEYQKQCQEAIDSVFEHHGEQLTLGSLTELKYLEMCWKEALRLRPPISGINRRVLHDVQLDNGLTIPKGCDAVIVFYDLHRDPKIFSEPEVFNPDRFTVEASSSRSSYAFLPFGGGLRNCIGFKYATLESKIVLAHFLRRYQVSTIQKEEDVKYVHGVVGTADPAIQLCLKERLHKS